MVFVVRLVPRFAMPPDLNPNFGRQTILCVDDDPMIRALVVETLQRKHHYVETASDGLEAWEKISSDLFRFSVVITDNNMPSGAGLALVQRLRAANYGGRIIVFSGNLTEKFTSLFQALKVDAMVPKGSSRSVLVAAVNGPNVS